MIKCIDLKHKYKNNEVLKGINIHIESGKVVGIIGPNGAGKTTTLSIMQNLLLPSAGKVIYKDDDIRDIKQKWKERIGVLLQSTSYIRELTVYEQVKLFAGLHNKVFSVYELNELLKTYRLHHVSNNHPNQISGGERQKLALLIAVIHDPTILFLDEPSTGLDPISMHELWDRVKMLNQNGMTIILTSHNMREVEVLCDEVIILAHGVVKQKNIKSSEHGCFLDNNCEPIRDFDQYYVDTITKNIYRGVDYDN